MSSELPPLHAAPGSGRQGRVAQQVMALHRVTPPPSKGPCPEVTVGLGAQSPGQPRLGLPLSHALTLVLGRWSVQQPLIQAPLLRPGTRPHRMSGAKEGLPIGAPTARPSTAPGLPTCIVESSWGWGWGVRSEQSSWTTSLRKRRAKQGARAALPGHWKDPEGVSRGQA